MSEHQTLPLSEPVGSELCLQCGLCCRGVLHSDLRILGDEYPRWAALFPQARPSGEHWASPLPCHHLDGARCSIYAAGRPNTCGAYECKLLQDYLGGRRGLADCLQAVRQAQEMIAGLASSAQAPSAQKTARLPQNRHSAPDLGETLDSREPRIWDYVGEFLTGDFEPHPGMAVDLRSLSAETLQLVAQLSYHLEAHFIVNPRQARLQALADRHGSDLCLQCGMCCQGLLYPQALLEPQEVSAFIHLLPVTSLSDGTPAFQLPCPQLGADHACQVYAQGRPQSCGRFRCELLKDYLEGVRDLDECLALVEQVQAQEEAPKAQRALLQEFFMEKPDG